MFVSLRNPSPGCVFSANRLPAAANAVSLAAAFSSPSRVRIAVCSSSSSSSPSRVRIAVCSSSSSSSNGDSVNSNGGKKKGSSVPSSNYVVPLDKSFASTYSSCITRPLAEILRDLNKKIPDNIIKPSVVAEDDLDHGSSSIPWYHANRMLSFYAPGWCGEIRDVIFSDAGSVTVVYRVTVRASDGEAHREATGTVSSAHRDLFADPVAAAEEIAFCKACARFGLGLYLYHDE